MRIIVCGLIAQYPLGGVAWDYLQYVLGLHRMGLDVYYIEDTGQWPFNPLEEGVSKGCEFNVQYLGRLMERFGLGDRWSYRFPYQNQWFGMPDAIREDVVQTADLLLNVSGCLEHPEKYRSVRTLAYIDSDPIFTQIKVLKRHSNMVDNIQKHDILFSFGEALADGKAHLPDTGLHWHPTRQPVVLSEWSPLSEQFGYTTIMNWTSYKDIEFRGRRFGQKDSEFKAFVSLPQALPQVRFEIALNDGKTRRSPKSMLRREGWHVLDPNEVCADLDGYRGFISSSHAEWSVAKGGYVEGGAGWFSCRSACYLAAGRPVVVQSTGFEPYIPTGEGILSFTDIEGARWAIDMLEVDYAAHAQAAQEVAESHFASDHVLSNLLDRCAR